MPVSVTDGESDCKDDDEAVTGSFRMKKNKELKDVRTSQRNIQQNMGLQTY